MQTSSAQFAAVIAGNEMTVDHKESIALPTTGLYSDLSMSCDSIQISRAVTTDMPDGTRLLTGYPTATADITLSGQVDPTDESKNAAWLFNPYSQASPLYRVSALNSPVTAQIGLRDGLSAPERLTTFTGFVDEVSTDPINGTATLSCLDWRTKLRGPPSIRPANTAAPSNLGLTSEYALDALLRNATSGVYSSWPAQRPNVILAAGMRTSVEAEVGVTSNGSILPNVTAYAPGEFGSALVSPDLADQDASFIGYNMTQSLPATSNLSVFVEFWASAPGPAEFGTSIELGDQSFGGGTFTLLNVELDGGSFFVTVTQVQLGVPTGPFTDTFSLSVPNDLAIHYCGALVTWAADGVHWSATLYYDNQVSASGTRAIPSATLPRVSSMIGVQVTTESSLEALQITTETNPGATLNNHFVPKAVLDPSLNALTAIPDTTTTTSDVWGVIQQITDAELGFAGFDELGIFRFKNRNTLNTTASTRTITSAASLKTMQTDISQASVVNHVQVNVNALEIEPLSQVWMLSNVVQVGPKATVRVVATLASSAVDITPLDSGEAPSGGGTPGNTYWRASYDINGVSRISTLVSVVATQINATTVNLDITNSNPRPVYLISSAAFTDIPVGTPYLAVGGQLVTPLSVQTLDAQWPPASEGGSASSAYGDILLTIDNPWVQTVDVGTVLMNYALEDLALPRPNLTGIAIVTDPRIQLSDRVTIQDPEVTGVNDDAIIFGITTTISGSDWSQSIDARTVGMPGRWILGDAVKSVLGVTTYP